LLRRSGFPELAAMTLRLEHREISHDRIQMLGAAFSTTSLPVALGLRIEKTALQIFLDQSSNWRSVARIIPAQSFREGAVVRLGMGSGFEKVGRDVELKTTFISEESSTYKIDTYGKAFHIARADLIDDSIGILNHIPMLIGNDSSKRIADTLFNTLTGTSATTGFFTSGDNSLLHDVLDFSGLAAAVAAIRTQKDVDGKPSVFNRRCSWFPPHSNSPRNNCSTPLSCSAIRRRIFNRREIPCRESSFSRRLRHDSMPTRKKIGLSGVPLHGAVLAAVLLRGAGCIGQFQP
jgi:hypothetical protein